MSDTAATPPALAGLATPTGTAAPGGPSARLAGAAPPAHPTLPPAGAPDGYGWVPGSACVAGCLPAEAELPRVGRLRVAARLTGMGVLLASAVPLTVVLPLVPPARRARMLRAVFRRALRTLGVTLVCRGERRIVPDGARGVLVVANHLSWLDILVLNAVQPMRMVAKREIRDWAVIGALAARFGTLFVERARLRSLPGLVAEAAGALRDGAVIGLFPEGTTWCGAASGPFRRAGFQAALDARVPVRPVAQRMRWADGTPTAVGAFIGDDTLIDSLLRVVRSPGLVVEVELLPALAAGDRLDRRELARRAELAIAAATGVPAPARPGRSRPHPSPEPAGPVGAGSCAPGAAPAPAEVVGRAVGPVPDPAIDPVAASAPDVVVGPVAGSWPGPAPGTAPAPAAA